MRRKDISYDSTESDVEELQRMIDEMDSLLNDAESRVCDIVSLLEIKRIDDLSDIYQAYENAKELSQDLY